MAWYLESAAMAAPTPASTHHRATRSPEWRGKHPRAIPQPQRALPSSSGPSGRIQLPAVTPSIPATFTTTAVQNPAGAPNRWSPTRAISQVVPVKASRNGRRSHHGSRPPESHSPSADSQKTAGG
jgi:hypothetical protein